MKKSNKIILIITFILLFITSTLISYEWTKAIHYEEVANMLTSSDIIIQNKYTSKTWYGKTEYHIMIIENDKPLDVEVNFKTYCRIDGEEI